MGNQREQGKKEKKGGEVRYAESGGEGVEGVDGWRGAGSTGVGNVGTGNY